VVYRRREESADIHGPEEFFCARPCFDDKFPRSEARLAADLRARIDAQEKREAHGSAKSERRNELVKLCADLYLGFFRREAQAHIISRPFPIFIAEGGAQNLAHLVNESRPLVRRRSEVKLSAKSLTSRSHPRATGVGRGMSAI